MYKNIKQFLLVLSLFSSFNVLAVEPIDIDEVRKGEFGHILNKISIRDRDRDRLKFYKEEDVLKETDELACFICWDIAFNHNIPTIIPAKKKGSFDERSFLFARELADYEVGCAKNHSHDFLDLHASIQKRAIQLVGLRGAQSVLRKEFKKQQLGFKKIFIASCIGPFAIELFLKGPRGITLYPLAIASLLTTVQYSLEKYREAKYLAEITASCAIGENGDKK